MDSSGLSIFSGLTLEAIVRARRLIPTRPINISTIRIALLAVERKGVIPAERPTVPNALVVSNTTFIKLSFSIIIMATEAASIRMMAVSVRVRAL